MGWLDWLVNAVLALELRDVSAAVVFFDILLRSFLLYCFACLVLTRLAIHATANARHKFLAFSLLLMGLLPALPSILARIIDHAAELALIVLLFEVSTVGVAGAENSLFVPEAVLATIYCLGVLYCLSRLLVAFLGLRELRKTADYCLEDEDLKLFRRVQSELKLQTAIGLAKSAQLQSPVTFGIASPLVLVPPAWDSWGQAEKLTVLRHELAHVKRADWLLNIAIGVLTSLNWFNPFIWLFRNKVLAESEHDCDFTVLSLGSPKYAYAGQLLMLARSGNRNSAWIHNVAAMVDVGELTARVDAILNYRVGQAESTGWVVRSILVTSLVLSSVVSSGKAVTVEDAALFKDAQLVHKTQPVYSSPNIFNGLEARTLLRFDVDAQGRVIAESIEVLRSTSPEVMVPPVVDAIKQFRFEPRIAHGRAVTAAGMEYEFSIGVYESSFNNH